MDYTTLGRTGRRVSVLGLGGGGHSRLGQQTGGTAENSVAIVRRALELGVNFIDTAEAYGTEPFVGEALAQRGREDVVISTKKTVARDGELITPQQLAEGLEASLRRLQTDYVDIYHLHGVRAAQYEYCRETLVPELRRLQDQGKIRFLGITEAFASDTAHEMMRRAVQDDCWDVVMVGFNILNQSARERVLSHTQAQNIGVLDMFAVRAALSRPTKLKETIHALIEQGALRKGDFDDLEEPLAFLLHESGAQSLTDAAYRFCRMEPGVHVVLSGTGNIQHLEENVASILRSPLPQADRARLMRLFEGIDNVSGQ